MYGIKRCKKVKQLKGSVSCIIDPGILEINVKKHQFETET
jgi:hypothetical protein